MLRTASVWVRMLIWWIVSYSQSLLLLLLLLPFLILFLRIHIQRMKTNRDSLTATINEKRERAENWDRWQRLRIGLHRILALCVRISTKYTNTIEQSVSLSFLLWEQSKRILKCQKLAIRSVNKRRLRSVIRSENWFFFPFQGERWKSSKFQKKIYKKIEWTICLLDIFLDVFIPSFSWFLYSYVLDLLMIFIF